MKKINWILRLFAATTIAVTFSLGACSEDDEPESKSKVRCLTGVNIDGDRVFIRCATKEQYMAGNNVSQGGTANWTNFTGHQWEECDNCN